MTTQVHSRSGRIAVGPPGGPTVTISTRFVISVTDEPPFDLRLEVDWDPKLGRHTLQQLTLTAQDGGDYVRMSRINQLALADIVERALTDAVVGPNGWPQVVAEHADADPIRVDALIYLLAYALGGQKPAATIAIARGLALSTGPKRAIHARQAGLIPPAEPGKASGTTSGDEPAATKAEQRVR
jgi:hypothetical protein